MDKVKTEEVIEYVLSFHKDSSLKEESSYSEIQVMSDSEESDEIHWKDCMFEHMLLTGVFFGSNICVRSLTNIPCHLLSTSLSSFTQR